MLIGSSYSDDKLYRGFIHIDGLPLTSKDVHEQADTLYRKTAMMTDTLIGSGILNRPSLVQSTTGVSLESPYVLLLEGDIVLIQSNSELLKVDALSPENYDGVLCIVGWYQAIRDEKQDNIKAYGGLDNPTLEYDLVDPALQIQVSGRYQFRWQTVYLNKSTLYSRDSDVVSISLPNRNRLGDIETGTFQITTSRSIDDILVAEKPASIDYISSEIYVIPLMTYKYTESSGTLSDVDTLVKHSQGSAGVEVSTTTVEPTGDINEGTIWYNPDTRELKVYIRGVGFVPTSGTAGLVRLHRVVTVENTNASPANLGVQIGIDEYVPGDVLRVYYEGLLLIEGEHYRVNTTTKSITLLSFLAESGDKIDIEVTQMRASIVV